MSSIPVKKRGPKDQLRCLSCHRLKGLSAFKDGVPVCGKCRNNPPHSDPRPTSPPLAVAPLPPIGVPEHKEPENKIDQFWAVQKARLDRSEKVYQEYIAAHPNEFKEGDHIIIVDNQTTLHRFDNHEAATEAARALAPDGGYYHTEYGHEKRLILIYNTIQGTFKGGAKNQMGYVKANVKNTAESMEEYKVEMLVDTGAGGCVISDQLEMEMGGADE